MNKKKIAIVIIVVFLLILGIAIVAFLISIEEPDVKVVDISVTKYSPEARALTLSVSIQIDNPNPISARLETISLNVYVADTQVGYSNSNVGTEITGGGNTLVVFPLIINDFPETVGREVVARASGMATVSVFAFSFDEPIDEATTLTLPIPKNIAPSANIRHTGGAVITVKEEIYFDGSFSTDPDGDFLMFLWDFGDGSPTETMEQVYHSYDAAGSYTVTLTVTDEDGATDTATVIIDVMGLRRSSK